jgi:hypothetical protein
MNTCSLLGALWLGVASSPVCALAADLSDKGLVAAWSFDETAGDEVKDHSRQGLDGTLQGAKRVEGKIGGAIQCGQDALVQVPHALALDGFKDGLTISAWVKRHADTSWNMIISREVKDGPSEYFGLAVFKGKALFSVDPDGAHYQNIKSDDDVPVGEWIHLAGTYDNKTITLFVNGRPVKSAPGTVPFKFNDTNPVIIGGNTNRKGKTWVDCFHGLIDEVRLYGRALDTEEVATLATDGSLKVVDSGTGPHQQVLFCDFEHVAHPRLVKAFGESNRVPMVDDLAKTFAPPGTLGSIK